MRSAVIFVPRCDDYCRWVAVCTEHVAARGYSLVGVMVGRSWQELEAVLDAGIAEVAVVAVRDHCPPERVEVASEWRIGPCRPTLTRPRVIR